LIEGEKKVATASRKGPADLARRSKVDVRPKKKPLSSREKRPQKKKKSIYTPIVAKKGDVDRAADVEAGVKPTEEETQRLHAGTQGKRRDNEG